MDNTALRCLTHPSSLLAVVGLLVNDHWGKSAVGNALTGKLSDFFGLYFFVFLMAVVLTPLVQLRGASSHSRRLAFAVTALWFAAIKTVPAAAEATEALSNLWLAGQSQIVCDPTDLVALVVLWPAWRLWDRLASQRQAPASRWVLVGALLASMGTSKKAYPERYHSCLVVDSYGVENAYGEVVWMMPDVSPGKQAAATSKAANLAVDSTATTALGTAAVEVPMRCQAPILPKTACTADRQTCYRLSANTIVDKYVDGKWSTIWSAERRLEYLKDRASRNRWRAELQGQDLAVVQSRKGIHVLVALGTEGVVELLNDEVAGLHAGPTERPSLYDDDGGETLFGRDWYVIWLTATMFVLVWLQQQLRVLLSKEEDRSNFGKRILRALGAIGVCAAILAPMTTKEAYRLESPLALYAIIIGAFLVPVFLVQILAAIQFVGTVEPTHAAVAQRIRNASLLLFLLLLWAGRWPFLAWTLGWLPNWGVAVLLHVALLPGYYWLFSYKLGPWLVTPSATK